MAALASFSPHPILHRFLLRRSAPACLQSAVVSHVKKSFLALQTTPSFTSASFIFSSPASSLAAASRQLANDVALLEDVQTEPEAENNTVSAAADAGSEGLKKSNLGVIRTPPPPSLTVRERKELASYAHSLGKKLKSQQVGKSGVTDTVVTALIETLEANELLKLKILGTCPGELEDVVKQLEETTGSIAVGQIGRTVILYRPSLTKLKAEEKKKQAQRVYVKRQPVSKQSTQSRKPTLVSGQEDRHSGRGRRGSSRL